MKKLMIMLSIVVFSLALFATVASAYGVTAKIGGNDGSPNVKVNTKFSHQGTIRYDSTILWVIPLPSTGYFYMEEPYMPVKVNSVSAISGSWTGATTYVSSGTYSGNSCYRFYRSFSLSGTVTKTVALEATGESFATSGTYKAYCGTGTGHTVDGGVTCDVRTVT